MKAYRAAISVFILLFFVLATLTAQEEVRTLEDLYLSTDIQIQLIRSQAVAESWDSKQSAINTIRRMHENGRVQANEAAVITVLSALAGEGVVNPVLESGRIVNDLPEIRRRAVYLLGDIGGGRAENALYNVLINEPQTMVLSEAIHALKRSGVTDRGKATKYVAHILMSNNVRVSPDNSLASACLSAIQELQLIDVNIISALIYVIDGNYGAGVRKQALDTIDFFRSL